MADSFVKVNLGDRFRVDHDVAAGSEGLYIEGTKVVGTVFGTPIANHIITWSAAEPTAGDAQTIANGGTPTVAELGQSVQNINTKLNLIIDALSGHGLITEA